MLTRRFNYLAHLHAARRLTADKGGSGGGGNTKPTLEEQLTAARSELDTLRPQITSLTSERDTARTEVTNLTAQFTEATNTATTLKAERDQARTDLTAMTTDRDTQKGRADKAESNVGRLEALCGVKGIDPKSAVPAIDEPKDGKGKTLTRAEFDKLSPLAKAEHCRNGGKITD